MSGGGSNNPSSIGELEDPRSELSVDTMLMLEARPSCKTTQLLLPLFAPAASLTLTTILFPLPLDLKGIYFQIIVTS
jgi:hypothetical protein